MRRIIEPLNSLGAMIESNDGLLPLSLGGSELNAHAIRLKVASAQVKTCILLAGLYANGMTTVIEPVATRDHTERMLEWLGVIVLIETTNDERSISINGGSALHSRDIDIPGDISSAAFLAVAAACLRQSMVTIRSVGLNPTRTGILAVLKQCGVDVGVENEAVRCNEPIGDLTIRSSSKLISPALIDGDIVANVIDELPIIAVLGTQLSDGIEVRGAKELRVKETDRIDAIVKDLRSVGVTVDEFDDGFRVHRSTIIGGEVNSFGDHRIAMAFAVAGLLSKDGVSIKNAGCTDISFPGFFETLRSLVE
jgi:3-phosphoshikimate 1-carboxyvinyltransferase